MGPTVGPAVDPAVELFTAPRAGPAVVVWRWLKSRFQPEPVTRPTHLWPRWLWIRALGGIFFSAFYSLAFQIHGLIGPHGILPASQVLEQAEGAHPGWMRYWDVPTLLWLGSSDRALDLLIVAGLASSVLLILNVWPRGTTALCSLLFLSFVSTARVFAWYQSDAMLMEAGFLTLFFAPPGLRPGLGANHRPSPASRFLLMLEWFRIYFESGVVKLASGDVEWRTYTALDHYYQNGPLPTWIGWYAHQLPHGFHAVTCVMVLVIELLLVWLAFFPRRLRLALCLLVTPMQVLIILTANYAFINYITLALGLLLLDDRVLRRVRLTVPDATSELDAPAPVGRARPGSVIAYARWWRCRLGQAVVVGCLGINLWITLFLCPLDPLLDEPRQAWIEHRDPSTLWSFLSAPARALDQFRIANGYGLFATMTEPRYELELQGSMNGVDWTPYPFRYKPQAVDQPPGIYAPYQPRFDWNLWFASIGTPDYLPSWRGNEDNCGVGDSCAWVIRTEALLAEGEPSVVDLFAANPFPDAPPREVRTVIWEYEFTDFATRRETGAWWRRTFEGFYGPMVQRTDAGTLELVATTDQ
jgi:hypothetical protein